MGDELEQHDVELVRQGEQVAVVGDAAAVEQFLRWLGAFEISRSIDLAWLRRTLGRAGDAADLASRIAESSGRWLKLTQESAAKLEKSGLMDTDIAGVKHAMLGRRGDIEGWLQVEQRAGSLFRNPDVVSGVATALAQEAMRQAIAEITDHLKRIDRTVTDVYRKLDDVRRAELSAVTHDLDEAVAELETQEFLSDATWSAMSSAKTPVGAVQEYALLQLEAIVNSLRDADFSERVEILSDKAYEVREWVDVLAASSLQFQRYYLLKLDRHRQEDFDNLGLHLANANRAIVERLDPIYVGTDDLLEALNDAMHDAARKRLSSRSKSSSVIVNCEELAGCVSELRRLLAAESDHRNWDLVPLSPRRERLAVGIQSVNDRKKEIGGVAAVVALKNAPRLRPLVTKALEAAAKAKP